jgi:hypothetical protein
MPPRARDDHIWIVGGAIHRKPVDDGYLTASIREKEAEEYLHYITGKPLFIEHESQGTQPVGYVKQAKRGPNECLFVWCEIDASTPGGRAAIDGIKTNKLRSFSLGNKVGRDIEGTRLISQLNPYELSLVNVPGEPLADIYFYANNESGIIVNEWALENARHNQMVQERPEPIDENPAVSTHVHTSKLEELEYIVATSASTKMATPVGGAAAAPASIPAQHQQSAPAATGESHVNAATILDQYKAMQAELAEQKRIAEEKTKRESELMEILQKQTDELAAHDALEVEKIIQKLEAARAAAPEVYGGKPLDQSVRDSIVTNYRSIKPLFEEIVCAAGAVVKKAEEQKTSHTLYEAANTEINKLYEEMPSLLPLGRSFPSRLNPNGARTAEITVASGVMSGRLSDAATHTAPNPATEVQRPKSQVEIAAEMYRASINMKLAERDAKVRQMASFANPTGEVVAASGGVGAAVADVHVAKRQQLYVDPEVERTRRQVSLGFNMPYNVIDLPTRPSDATGADTTTNAVGGSVSVNNAA